MSLTHSEHAPIPTKPGSRDNWIERSGPGGKGGHLPGPIDSIARALISKGWEKGRAIGTAVASVKRGCATGTAFGGKAKLKPETRATMCKASAEWERMRASAHAKNAVKEQVAPLTGRDLDALYVAAESALLELRAEVGGRDALMEMLAAEGDLAEEARSWLAVLDGAQGPLRLAESWEPLMEKWSDKARMAAADKRRGQGSGHSQLLGRVETAGHSGGAVKVTDHELKLAALKTDAQRREYVKGVAGQAEGKRARAAYSRDLRKRGN